MPRGVRKNKTTGAVRMAVRFTFKDATGYTVVLEGGSIDGQSAID